MSRVDVDMGLAAPVTVTASPAVPRVAPAVATIGGSSGGIGQHMAPNLALLGVLVLWEVLGRAETFGHAALPPPTAIVEQLWRDRAIYPANIATTLREAWPGFLWGNVAAIALGMVFVLAPPVEKALSGAIVGLLCMPLIAIGPVLAIVLNGDAPKSALAGLSVFFLTLIAMVLGMRSADRASIDVVRAAGGGWWAVMRRVRLRSAVPTLVVAIQLAVPSALLGALLGEFMGGTNGLGVTMMASMSQLETARTWGLALTATALGGVGYLAVGLVARLLGVAGAEPPISVAPASGRRHQSLPVRGLRAIGFAALSVVVTLGLWLMFVKGLHLSPFFAKTPADVWRFIGTNEHRRVLLHALGQTAPTALLGYLVGLAAACAGAMTFVLWRGVERAIMPLALVVQSIPLAALTPLLVLLLGRGLMATVVISVLVTFFPSLVMMTKGLRATSPQLLDVLRTYDASRWTTLRRVQLPTAVPGIFAAARASAPRALLGVLIAEYLATGTGIGWMLNLAKTRSEFSLVWTGAVTITVISVLAYSAVGWVERTMLARYAPEVLS